MSARSLPLRAMRSSLRLALSLLLLGLFAPTARGQARPYTPARGTPERAAILDALRANVRDVPGLGGPFVFRVEKMGVLGEWAFVTVLPTAPDGSALVAYEENLECDRETTALLRRRGTRWAVVQREVGPCDFGWPETFAARRAPQGLLRFWMDAGGG